MWKCQNYAVWTNTISKFSAFEHHAELVAGEHCSRPEFIETLQIWTHWTNTSGLSYVWDAMLENYHKHQPKPKTTDELQAALQTMISEKLRGELHQALSCDCLHGCGCHWWSLRASAVTLSISKSASSSTTLGIKQHNCVVFRYISTKLGGKVYML